MYYIVNQDKQIIAADADFLSLLGVESLQELFVQAAGGTIGFEEQGDHTLKVSPGSDTLMLEKKSTPLSTMMGDLLLYDLQLRSEESDFDILSDEEAIDLVGGEEVKIEIKAPAEEPEPESEEETLQIDKSQDEELSDEIIGLAEPEEEEIDFLKSETEEEPEEKIDFLKSEVEEEKIDLLGDESEVLEPKQPAVAPEAEEHYEVVTEEKDTINLLPDEEPLPDETVSVDTEAISKILGISQKDYTDFLDEFIEKAIEEEGALKENDTPEQQKAITSLHKLSRMLHLDPLSGILDDIVSGVGAEKEHAIERFYHALSTIKTAAEPEESEAGKEEAETESYAKAICELSLEGIKPIHFDFQPQQASSELGLPLELIIEFTHDFIAQAHEEEETFYDACRAGDIDTIHRTAHKLKGVASNLRIVPLAETLEELQFSEETSRFEPLLKKYWGQFLTLENLMSTISNQKGGK